MQTQSGQLASQPVLLDLAEPQGAHVPCEGRLRHDAVHGRMPQSSQQLPDRALQAGPARLTGDSILHATHPRSLHGEIKGDVLTMSTDDCSVQRKAIRVL
ncbi:hypothetical protein [Streptomyces shenzhenensis]|uniref:hypothetical protein n=1 Tax=Streptomyces shenzhenensis TaxID=943815 RepID=UPI001F3E19F0|nr:hypothetical protein [Streptomyces shenzhenensis]